MQSKKAQNVGQIFIYILAVVIVGVILAFGFRAIMDFSDKTEEVALAKFQKNFGATVKSITNQYGTLRTSEFQISNEFQDVCFLNNYDFDPSEQMNIVLEDHPLIYDTLRGDNPTTNTFLISNKGRIEDYEIGSIKLDSNFECFNVTKGTVTLRLEGKGDHIIIS